MIKNKMNTAYQIAHELMRDRLKDRAPEFLEELDDIKGADVIITDGAYDRIQKVMQQAGTPFTLISPLMIDQIDLRPDQIVFVNCPGHFSPGGIKKLEKFVREGGFLFTTDWALKFVLEPAFPGVVAYNDRKTRDEVVRVEVLDTEDPFLASLLDESDDPLWWLEGSSFPIKILDKERVKVLVKSSELANRYGEEPVFISFDHGEGKVYHMISHYYLQRSETRTKRHKAPSTKFMQEKGIKPERMKKFLDLGAETVPLGDVESAFTNYSMYNSVLYEKMKRERDRKLKKREGEKSEQPKKES